jgi:enoyl-CoA hydratase/carnithine racemase
MSSEAVQCVIEGNVAKLAINRPEKRNAINGEVIDGLLAHIGELAWNNDVRVIVIYGQGPCFSAGIDVTYIAGLGTIEENLRGAYLRELARKIQSALNRIENIEKPVVAVMHKYALGLAMELALACDFRIASKGTVMGLPEIYMGLVPDCGGTTRLTRALGVPKAKELVMLGDTIDMNEAKELRLVNAVADEADLWKTADALVARLIDRPRRVLGLAKRLVDISASIDEMSSFELETIVQSNAVSAPDFPEILAGGVQKLMKKK